MADDRAPPPLNPGPAGGLFSERQIALPLAIALLVTLALYLTLRHFQDPAELTGWWGRYLGNGYCQLMAGVFVATGLYAALQYLGLRGDARQLRHPLGHRDGPPPSRLQDWGRFLSGRTPREDERDVPGALRRWYGNARSREDLARLSDYVLLLRGQQHQHNFAPIGFAIWVLPLLGFIGTVVGITQAIAGLEQTVTPGAARGGLGEVLGGLTFAFDTTLIGLVLVIPVMLLLLALRARAQKLDMLYYQMLLDRLFHDAN